MDSKYYSSELQNFSPLLSVCVYLAYLGYNSPVSCRITVHFHDTFWLGAEWILPGTCHFLCFDKLALHIPFFLNFCIIRIYSQGWKCCCKILLLHRLTVLLKLNPLKYFDNYNLLNSRVYVVCGKKMRLLYCYGFVLSD